MPDSVPAVTRDQARELLFNSPFGPAGDNNLVSATVGEILDSVMALMALLAEAPQPKVLAEALLVQAVRANTSNTGLLPVKGKSCLPWYLRLDAPPGTRVLLVEAPASPAPEEPTP